MKQAYGKRREVTKRLDAIFMELRNSGESFFPSERKLSEMLGTTRKTLRHCLKTMEDEGLLIKGERGRVLAPNKKPGARVVFTCAGDGVIHNPTWGRLWGELKERAENFDFNLELALLTREDNEGLYVEFTTDPPDIIILGDSFDKDQGKMLRFRGKSILISVDEQYEKECDYCVCLDNFAVGELAARTLLSTGYENPVFVGQARTLPYQPFLKRAEGFASTLRASGLAFDDSSIRWIGATKHVRFIRNLINEIERVARESHDAMFLYSDEQVEFVYDILSESKNIPGEFGLFTTAGSELSRSHIPMISATSHSDRRTAKALIKLIEKITSDQKGLKKKILIKPELLKGETIREKR